MAAQRIGRFIPTNSAQSADTIATAFGNEANCTATVDKTTRRTVVEVTAVESAGGADDAETQLSNAVTAVGDVVQAPGTSYVDS